MSDLYDIDIVLWAEQQAARLREVAANDRLNDASPDWPNIIEEIEDVGGSAIRSVSSLLFRALLHDLKCEAWPLSSHVEHWRAEARVFRVQAAAEFTPSMRQRLDVARIYARAVRALPGTVDGLPPMPVPQTCPVTLDELLAEP